MQIQEKRGHLLDSRARHRVAMTTTPSPINRPLGLVIHPGGRALAVGKLASHCRSEAERTANRSRYDMQSDEAQGGSDGSDGSAAV